MDTNISLPAALLMAFFLAAPPSGTTSLPPLPEPQDLEAILDGQEELLERNVRACLAQMAPLMPEEMRVAMAEQITAQWYESGFEGSRFAAEIDMDEMESLAEAMEEEVLPALEDAGYTIDSGLFRASLQWSQSVNRIRAAKCATQLTLMQLQTRAPEREEAAVDALPEEDTAAAEESTAPDDGAVDPVEEAPAGIQRIVY